MTSDIYSYTTGDRVADEVLRRAAKRTAVVMAGVYDLIEPLEKNDPAVLAAHAESRASEYRAQADEVERASDLQDSWQPADPAHAFRRELRNRYWQVTGVPARWREPIELGFDYEFHPAPGANGGLRVNLSFDGNVSLTDAVRAVREVWKVLGKLGRSKKPKSVGERSLTLAQFVCFESEGMSWAGRAAAWNARYPEWAYADGREMYKAFTLAEKSIVGTAGSLTYYYDEEWRLIVDTPEGERTGRQGVRAARRMKERADESLNRVLAGLDDPSVAALAPADTEPAVWKLRAASTLCHEMWDYFAPDPTDT